MLAMLVCSLDEGIWMYYQNHSSLCCTNCHDSSELIEFLQSQLMGDELSYSEWISEEGQTMMKKTIDPVDVFVKKLTLKLQGFSQDNYMSDKQGHFF